MKMTRNEEIAEYLIGRDPIPHHTDVKTKAQLRKEIPLASGVLGYFPLALQEVAKCSWVGNEQHNPGQPLHWDRTKSKDHADCMLRHFLDRGTIDSDGVRHAAKCAWRALAMLELEMEAFNVMEKKSK